MKKLSFLFFTFFSINCLAQSEVWLTDFSKKSYFAKSNESEFFESNIQNKQDQELGRIPSIFIDTKKVYQEMDGFGFTLTSASASLINKMSSSKRNELLQNLFGQEKNDIGISYLRIGVGASDLSEKVYSYNDLKAGEKDILLEKFSIQEDEKELIPVLIDILRISPKIKILASPWSPPTWMKSKDKSMGGSLLPEYYGVYAKYLLKFIKEFQKKGIKIDALTIQNEPLHPGNNPSLLMLPSEQAEFIKSHLGPLFKKEKVKTKIIIYDHNADRPDYAIEILNDLKAKRFIDGTAFHLYGGQIENLSQVHDLHSDKNIYFTEQWIGAPGNMEGDMQWHVKNLIIGASRNWAKTVLEWNLASDKTQSMHTEGGCTECLGAITIDNDLVLKNPAYYIIAHASKHIRPGSKRIYSNTALGLNNVAFLSPDNKVIMILYNESDNNQEFLLSIDGKKKFCKIKAKSIATVVF